MKLRWLIALGVIAYLVFAIVTLPASVVLDRLRDSGITAAGVEGTAWKGRAELLQVQGVNVGRVDWDLHALALLALKVRADVKVTRSDGFLQSVLDVRSGPIRFSDLSASVPLSALSGIAPQGWSGTVNLRFAELIIDEGWPVSANGSAEILNLESTSRRSPLTGSYKLTFPAPDTQPANDVLVGAITDLGGPLAISGTVELRRDRSYLLSGLVAAKPDAPRNLANQLQILGPPDPQGRRQFSLEGTL
jgi:general secretion pathway protein N